MSKLKHVMSVLFYTFFFLSALSLFSLLLLRWLFDMFPFRTLVTHSIHIHFNSTHSGSEENVNKQCANNSEKAHELYYDEVKETLFQNFKRKKKKKKYLHSRTSLGIGLNE